MRLRVNYRNDWFRKFVLSPKTKEKKNSGESHRLRLLVISTDFRTMNLFQNELISKRLI